MDYVLINQIPNIIIFKDKQIEDDFAVILDVATDRRQGFDIYNLAENCSAKYSIMAAKISRLIPFHGFKIGQYYTSMDILA